MSEKRKIVPRSILSDGDEVNNIGGDLYIYRNEEPYVYISDRFYKMMVDLGESRSKEEIERAYVLQFISKGKYDARLLIV